MSHILFIESDPVAREPVTSYLRALNISITEVMSVAQASRSLVHHSGIVAHTTKIAQYDAIVVTDLIGKELFIHGRDFIKSLRTFPLYARLPILGGSLNLETWRNLQPSNNFIAIEKYECYGQSYWNLEQLYDWVCKLRL